VKTPPQPDAKSSGKREEQWSSVDEKGVTGAPKMSNTLSSASPVNEVKVASRDKSPIGDMRDTRPKVSHFISILGLQVF
jgi:hypothetical protein